MNILEHKDYIDRVIETAKEFGENPSDIIVSIQIDEDQISNNFKLK